MVNKEFFFKGFKSIIASDSPAIALGCCFVAIGALLKNLGFNIQESIFSTMLTYALPGAVIGLSLIILFSSFSFKTEILIGSFAVLIYAYVMRYMAVGISPLKSSFEKHPASYDDTAVNLGMSPLKLFKSIPSNLVIFSVDPTENSISPGLIFW